MSEQQNIDAACKRWQQTTVGKTLSRFPETREQYVTASN
jgi:hypothetical protein